MRIMAIDYGDARTGVAISDPTGLITGRAWTIHEHGPGKLAELIKTAASENGVERLVLGYPKNMNDTLGERAQKCEKFAETLRDLTGLEVVMWDERRTTVDAQRILSENNRYGKKRKDSVDAVAASLILEGYLSFISR